MGLLGSLILLLLVSYIVSRAIRAALRADRGEERPQLEGIDHKLAREMRKVAERIGQFYD